MRSPLPRLLRAAVPAATLLCLVSAPAYAVSNPEGELTFNTVGCGGGGGVTANEYTVPLGVGEIELTAQGSAGQASGAASGGDGAVLTADLSVTPGDKLYFCIGQGGGAGGLDDGSAGGGYTLVSKHADASDPLMIAGGGGGASSLGGSVANGGQAGFAGGTAVDGSIGSAITPAGGGRFNQVGGGGTQSGAPVISGQPGSGHDGGDGGYAAVNGYSAGGGGGGGYYGGGGGGGAVNMGVSGGGGGGGSSFCTLSCASAFSGAQTPQVKIAWDAKPLIRVDAVSSFGTVKPGETSAPQTVTFRNVGTATMTLTGAPVIMGEHAADFALSGDGCSQGTIAPDGSCSVDVVFRPSASGKRNAFMLLTTTDNVAMSLPELTGVGEGAAEQPPVTDTTPPPVTPVTPVAPGGDTAKPAPDTCSSRRVVDLRVPSRFRAALRTATASIGGKTVATFRNGKARIDLSGRGAGKVRVKVVMKLRGGRTRTETRTYALCVPRPNH